jgi:hypothetical protein
MKIMPNNFSQTSKLLVLCILKYIPQRPTTLPLSELFKIFKFVKFHVDIFKCAYKYAQNFVFTYIHVFFFCEGQFFLFILFKKMYT